MADTFVKIATVTVGAGGATSMVFSSIPQTYTDLCIKASARNDSSGTGYNMIVQFNGSTTTYTNKQLLGTGSAASSGSNSINQFGIVATSSNTANTFGNNELYIPNYTSSNYKSSSGDGVGENNATAAYAILDANLWSTTSAITQITLLPGAGNFVQYSTATLYGILKA